MEIIRSLDGAEDLKEKILLLGQLETHLEATNEIFQHVTSLDDEDVLRFVEVVVDPGLVKDCTDLEERDFDKSDFQGVAEAAEKCFSCLKHLLSMLNVKVTHPKSHKSFSINILKLCATHSKEEFMWSSAEAVSLSQEILDLLLKIASCSTLGDLLCAHSEDHPNDIFKFILLLLRPSLSKETWTCNPSVCHIFQWLLFNVQHPHLSNHLSDVFPPSLMFIDHHTNEKKILGIECLQHIIDNIPAMELKMYGRADVVYDVLHRLIYLNEPDIVDVLYPCLLKFLSGQEWDPRTAAARKKWGRYDDIYHQLILNLQIEERVVLRRAYSRQLPIFIDKMGITVVKHLRSTIPVLLKCLAVYDGPEEVSCINSLLALRSLIRVAWPRMELYMVEFLKSLLFLSYDVKTRIGIYSDKVRNDIVELCEECLLLFKRTCPSTFEILTADLRRLQNIPGIEILESVCNRED